MIKLIVSYILQHNAAFAAMMPHECLNLELKELAATVGMLRCCDDL